MLLLKKTRIILCRNYSFLLLSRMAIIKQSPTRLSTTCPRLSTDLHISTNHPPTNALPPAIHCEPYSSSANPEIEIKRTKRVAQRRDLLRQQMMMDDTGWTDSTPAAVESVMFDGGLSVVGWHAFWLMGTYRGSVRRRAAFTGCESCERGRL